jgi:RNA polymerase sigma-70 factor, ECF subfamily
MEQPDPADVTRLLRAWASGRQDAMEELAPVVYQELRRIARRYMRREAEGNTLQTTALVNEAFLRLLGGTSPAWQDRLHFFAVAAQMMRRILIDAARARLRDKRGGASPRVTLDEKLDALPLRPNELIALDDALAELATLDPRRAQVVELRYFGGLSVEETAEVLHVSPQTVMRDWKLAKGWLARSMAR